MILGGRVEAKQECRINVLERQRNKRNVMERIQGIFPKNSEDIHEMEMIMKQCVASQTPFTNICCAYSIH